MANHWLYPFQPGFGRILVDHLLVVADPKMPIPIFNDLTLNLKPEKICRESFKELKENSLSSLAPQSFWRDGLSSAKATSRTWKKAFMLAAKYHLYTPPGRTAIQQSSARKKESLTFITKLIGYGPKYNPGRVNLMYPPSHFSEQNLNFRKNKSYRTFLNSNCLWWYLVYIASECMIRVGAVTWLSR